MAALLKITSNYYKTEDGKYEVKKEYTWHYKRLHKVWKMYKDGEYMGQPETIADAKQWIKTREA